METTTNIQTSYQYDLYGKPFVIQQSFPSDKRLTSLNEKAQRDLLNHVISTTLSDEGSDNGFQGDTYLYDAMGQLTQIKNPQNQLIKKLYYPNGKLKQSIDFAGNKTDYTYDHLGRVSSMKTTSTTGSQQIIELQKTYTAFGKVQSEHKLINNQLTSSMVYGYTNFTHQLQSITYEPDIEQKNTNQTVSWTIQNGHVTTFRDATHHTTTYTYQNNQLLSVQVDSKLGGAQIIYSYYNDETGNAFNQGLVQSVTYRDKNGKGLKKTLSYNAEQKPTEEYIEALDSGYQAPEDTQLIRQIKNKYDLTTGNLTQVQVSSTMDESSNSNYTQCYQYNDANQLTESYRLISGSSCSSSIRNADRQNDITYAHDIRNNVTKQTVSNSLDTNNVPNETTTYTYNNLNQLTQVESSDQEVEKLLSYDRNGNLLSDTKGSTYNYNSLNQLVGLTNKAGDHYTYHYYPNGLRSQKALEQASPISFYYDNSKNGQIVNEQQNEQTTSYFMAGSARIVRYAPNKKGTITTQVLIHNGKDVDALYNPSHQDIRTYHYSPYGETWSLSQDDIDKVLPQTKSSTAFNIDENPYGYSGEYQDQESGLVYLRARYYNPTLHTFMQRDTENLLNRYSYVDGNPIMSIDPSGHLSKGLKIVIGIGIAATLLLLSRASWVAYINYRGRLGLIRSAINPLYNYSDVSDANYVDDIANRENEAHEIMKRNQANITKMTNPVTKEIDEREMKKNTYVIHRKYYGKDSEYKHTYIIHKGNKLMELMHGGKVDMSSEPANINEINKKYVGKGYLYQLNKRYAKKMEKIQIKDWNGKEYCMKYSCGASVYDILGQLKVQVGEEF